MTINAGILLNEIQRHKTWESLEASLVDLLVKQEVLEYKREEGPSGPMLVATLNGLTMPVKLPIPRFAPPPEPQTPPPPQPAALAASDFIETETKTETKAKKLIGFVSIGGVVEDYEKHIRRLIRWLVDDFTGGSGKEEATAEECVRDWMEGGRNAR